MLRSSRRPRRDIGEEAPSTLPRLACTAAATVVAVGTASIVRAGARGSNSGGGGSSGGSRHRGGTMIVSLWWHGIHATRAEPVGGSGRSDWR